MFSHLGKSGVQGEKMYSLQMQGPSGPLLSCPRGPAYGKVGVQMQLEVLTEGRAFASVQGRTPHSVLGAAGQAPPVRTPPCAFRVSPLATTLPATLG